MRAFDLGDTDPNVKNTRAHRARLARKGAELAVILREARAEYLESIQPTNVERAAHLRRMAGMASPAQARKLLAEADALGASK